MNDTLVQNIDLLDEQTMHVHSEEMQYKAESNARQYAQKGNSYRSISAFISASRLASSVGCHNPMSKCFFRKGHTALSSTRNKKNLWIIIKVNNENNDHN
jgi:hypothetical protein